MRIGLGPIALAGTSRDQLEALAHAAVAASFDAVWVAEDRAHGVGGAVAVASMLAQLVPIRVGAVIDLGFHHPLYTAEDIAVADISTGGRLEVTLRPAGRTESDDEDIDVVALALSGAHVQWGGEQLKIPARLDVNQPAPSRLAVNPQPLQPVVPIWLMETARPGFGLARRWTREVKLEGNRIPDLLLCPDRVEANKLLAAAAGHPGYFLVAAHTPEAVAESGRRLVGPLRMPEFPDWVNA